MTSFVSDFHGEVNNFYEFHFTVRLKITVREIWSDSYKDKTSETFKKLAQSLKQGIESIYANKNTEETTILAQVVEVR